MTQGEFIYISLALAMIPAQAANVPSSVAGDKLKSKELTMMTPLVVTATFE